MRKLGEYNCQRQEGPGRSAIEPSYSWIACQLQVGHTLAFLLLRSDFKSETSFGFLSPDYTGRVTLFFCKTSTWPRLTSRREKVFFRGV